jgi:hypothetical protein
MIWQIGSRHRCNQLSVALATLAAAVVLSACEKTSFGGNKKKSASPEPLNNPSPTPKGKGEVSPDELDGLGQRPPSKPIVECAGDYRGIRMAIVIDTSLSMGSPSCGGQVEQIQQVQTQGVTPLDGSDPARKGTSIRGANECFTDRQNAAWHIVTRTAERDAEGEKINKTFMGSAVGIAHFPYQRTENYAKISGEPPLRSIMTALTGLTYDDAFKGALWTSLARTHASDGMTPYLAALSAGRDLLKTGRDPNDPRKDVLFLITDGLPTDQRPSQVIAMRQEIKDVEIVYLYMFDPNQDEVARQSVAKETLRGGFVDEQRRWARQPGNTDGYGAADFEKYWNDLVGLPSRIATTRIDVTDPAQLVPKIDAVLGVLQNCKK